MTLSRRSFLTHPLSLVLGTSGALTLHDLWVARKHHNAQRSSEVQNITTRLELAENSDDKRALVKELIALAGGIKWDQLSQQQQQGINLVIKTMTEYQYYFRDDPKNLAHLNTLHRSIVSFAKARNYKTYRSALIRTLNFIDQTLKPEALQYYQAHPQCKKTNKEQIEFTEDLQIQLHQRNGVRPEDLPFIA